MARVLAARFTFLADDYAGYEVRGLVGQHGLSVLIEVLDEKYRVHSVLFDAGQHGGMVLHNAELLGVDLGGVESIVLSHNHYDHTGGLLDILKAIGRRVPVVAHPFVFKPSIYVKGSSVRLDIGIPFSRRELEDVGADFILTRSALEVAPGVYYLGEIRRVYEHLAPLLEGNYTVNDAGELVPHPLTDDTGVAVVVEGYGAVVVGGCSHSGIVNIVKAAEKVTAASPRAVMGGFHMLGFKDDMVWEVIRLFREFGVEEVHTGHCTGLRAECMFMESYKSNFAKIHAGYTVCFGEREYCRLLGLWGRAGRTSSR